MQRNASTERRIRRRRRRRTRTRAGRKGGKKTGKVWEVGEGKDKVVVAQKRWTEVEVSDIKDIPLMDLYKAMEIALSSGNHRFGLHTTPCTVRTQAGCPPHQIFGALHTCRWQTFCSYPSHSTPRSTSIPSPCVPCCVVPGPNPTPPGWKAFGWLPPRHPRCGQFSPSGSPASPP